MIISCPSCGASFNVKPEALGPTGRSVKCSKCAHKWHATSDESELDAMPAEPEAVTEAPAADQDVGASHAEETEETDEAELAATADNGVGDMADAQDTADSADETERLDPAAEPETPPGLDAALGLRIPDSLDEDDDESPPSRSRPRRSPAARKPRRSVAKVLSFFVLLLLIAGIGSAAFFLNQQIMMWMPATQRLYAMVGIKPHVLGQGLQIVEPTPKKEIDGNDEILVIEGEIRNITKKPLTIPLMRGALLDKQGKELHIWTFTAAKSNIAPGENAPYRTEFRNPPIDAESLDITFTRAKEVTGMATQEVKMEKEPDGMTDTMPKDGDKNGAEKTH
jgi:predicted Zn finger-like uncharacterized protein